MSEFVTYWDVVLSTARRQEVDEERVRWSQCLWIDAGRRGCDAMRWSTHTPVLFLRTFSACVYDLHYCNFDRVACKTSLMSSCNTRFRVTSKPDSQEFDGSHFLSLHQVLCVHCVKRKCDIVSTRLVPSLLFVLSVDWQSDKSVEMSGDDSLPSLVSWDGFNDRGFNMRYSQVDKRNVAGRI